MSRKINSILYIDDDVSLGFLVRATLIKKWPDCIIACLENLDDAVSSLKTNAFDLLIIDYCLPGISAQKLLQMIREISDSPAIIISGLTAGDMRDLSAMKGLIGVLQKPFSVKTIGYEIEKLWDDYCSGVQGSGL